MGEASSETQNTILTFLSIHIRDVLLFPFFRHLEGKQEGGREEGPLWFELRIDLLSRCASPGQPTASEAVFLSFTEPGYRYRPATPTDAAGPCPDRWSCPSPSSPGILSFRDPTPHKPPLSASESPGLCRCDSCSASCLSLGHKHLLPCLIPSAKGVLLSPVNATRAHVAPRCSICPPRAEARMERACVSSTLLNHRGLLCVVRGFRISENENVLP